MTEVDRISLAPSVSSSTLIRVGLLMKSTRRSVDQEGEMSWPESKRTNMYSAAVAPAESNNSLRLIYNQTTNYSTLIKTTAHPELQCQSALHGWLTKGLSWIILAQTVSTKHNFVSIVVFLEQEFSCVWLYWLDVCFREIQDSDSALSWQKQVVKME